MAKYVRVEMIELSPEQLAEDAGAPVEHFQAARQWLATGHQAYAAVAQRAASAPGSGYAWGAASQAADGGAALRFRATTFRRLVDVPGDQLVDLLGAWWLRGTHDDRHLR